MTYLKWPWEGPRTYVRNKTVRGSAPGSEETDACIMAGYDERGVARGRCGLRHENPKLMRNPVIREGHGVSPDREMVCNRCLATTRPA